MAIPNTNGIFIHNGLNCSSAYIPTAQSIPMSPSDSTTVKTVVDNKSDLSIIADEYDTSATYTLGDFVIYDKVLYKCIMHSTTGAWDSTRWVAVNSKDSGINLKNSSGNALVKIWEDNLGRGTISLYDKTTGYDTVSLYGSGYVDAKSITVMTSGQSNSGRIELTTTQSNSGYISLRDAYKNTPIDLNADDGNINAISLNGVTIGASPQFTDTTYSAGTGLSLSGTTFSVKTGYTTSGNNRAVQADASGNLYVAQKDNDTTYTFANGTNGFTVTPAGGSAQTVTVTPSIPYNVTGSGTEGCLAKFSTERTITNGPAFGSSTSTYLRNDGNWTTPTNNAVTQTNTTGTNASYRVLLSATNDDTTRTEGARKNGDLYYNPSTNSLHSTKFNGYTLGAACAYSATTSVTSGSGALVTSGAVYTGLSGKQNTLSTSDVSSSLSVSGNLQSVTKKLFKYGNVVELFMTGNVKTAIADNGIFMTVPTGYNPKVNDVGFTFFTGTDQYIPTGFKFGYFTWGGRDFHTLGALGVGTQVTVHITYLI